MTLNPLTSNPRHELFRHPVQAINLPEPLILRISPAV
jgi:hypothetical protein